MKYFILLSLFISQLFSFNIDIYDSTIANGKTTLLQFKEENKINYTKVMLGKKKYKVYKHPSKEKLFYALIPVGYYEKPKNIKAKIFYKDKEKIKSKTIFFKITDGKYKKEKIKVQKSKVTLNEKDKKRVSKEYKEAMKIYNHSTKESFITSKFVTPMQSKITSSFGKARVYNDTLKGYHSGTDYRAKIGTPIVASNSGKIVLVKNRFYSGGSVIIDHGHGIYTCYYHMSKFNVKKDTLVKKGQVIGLSGVSGRVTGPHLHFSARVGGKQVDPLQLIELINKNLF